MRVVHTLLGMLVGLSTAATGWSLDPRLDAGGFREEDLDIAEEIARFSAEERHAALVAAGHPEDLLAVQQIQSESADDFAELVEGFSRDDQEQIWDLVRYPGLVADLARGGAKTDPELERIAARYPEEIRAAIRSEGRERYATWVEIYALDLQAEQAFSSVIARHPADVRGAFQRLRGRPDLLSVLVDDIGFATRIGAAYREDPTRVEARFDSLHQDVAARRSEQEKSWAKELENPESRKELETAAREFAEDQGYSLDDPSDRTVVQTRVVHVDHYVNTNPYPYWFGYPTWYDYPYWYPGSVWSHVGFRFGGGNGYVSIGLPSPYFLGWYNNYYGGPRFGYGVGYGYGYGAGYGAGYWNYPSYYYGGYRPYRHHGSGHHSNQAHHLRGNRHHGSHSDGRDGRFSDGRSHSTRQESSGRESGRHGLSSRPHRDIDTRIGDRNGTRQRSGDRSQGFGPQAGRERIQPDRHSAGDGRTRSGSPHSVSPSPDGSQGGQRFERGHRSLRSREVDNGGGTQLHRDRGQRRTPDVSSGPPARFARSERRDVFPRSQQLDRSARRDGHGSAPREFSRSSRDAGRQSSFSSGGGARQQVLRSNHGGGRSGSMMSGPNPGRAAGGERSHGGGQSIGGQRGGGGGGSSIGHSSGGRSGGGHSGGGHGGGSHGGGRGGGSGGGHGGGGGRSR